ncbi:ATP-binding protein, partial [Oceanidesulfovibrio marinus]|uniref:ATP-binding protein n=1 Tax=Oceanidesulfovibrio marinus TaxID=370038 RepID=UPI001F3417DE
MATYALPAPDKGTARVLLSISATGPGIEDASFETLFDSFTQAHARFTRSHQGAGPGLAILKQLVTPMGGTTAVESEPGKGTTLHIGMTFSVVEEDALDRGTASQPIMNPGREGLRVLLVDDYMISQFSIEVILKKRGHSVATAINGKS